MSAHVWTNKRFKPATLTVALECLKMGQREGWDPETCVRFAGYAVEAIRQAGWGKVGPNSLLRSARRYSHRYALGRNRDNYLEAGRRMLAALAGLDPDAPYHASWDRLVEQERFPG